MKHIYVYLNPSKSFDQISEALVKIQIDSLYSLGITPPNILLITNFDYSYKDIKSIVLGDHTIYKRYPRASKTTALFEMFRLGLMVDPLYWVKDIDLFQLRNVSEEEIGIDGYEAGFTTYGYLIDGKERWNTGSFFITNKCESLINSIYGGMFYHHTEEENSFIRLMEEKYKDGKVWNIAIKKLSKAYNVGFRGIEWDIGGVKDIAALHFPLRYLERMKPYMNEELQKIMSRHLVDISPTI